MSLVRYDLRTRGGQRRRLRLRRMLRPMTPRERRLAGWFVYGLVVWFVIFGIDQKGTLRVASGLLDSPPAAIQPKVGGRFAR